MVGTDNNRLALEKGLLTRSFRVCPHLRVLSDKTYLLEQKVEWTLLHRGWVLEVSFMELAVGPELKHVEVVWTSLDVII